MLGLTRQATRGLPSRAQQEAFGVTRLARVTGLDRTGLEVACAVRPTGHVLQVSNGKGRTWPEAARGALSEAAELWASEHPEPFLLRWGTPEEVARHTGAERVWDAGVLGVPAWLPPEARTTWAAAGVLGRRDVVFVPASAVYCPPPDGPYLGPAVVAWTSNGTAAHPLREEAVLRALLEATERHLLALALPEGFTPEAVARGWVPPEALSRLAPWVAGQQARLQERGFELALFLLTPRRGAGAVQLPLAAALLFDAEEGPHPVMAGYACRPSAAEALEGALLEAAQSRLTDIHGAREDIAAPDREGARLLREMVREVASGRRRREVALPAPLRGRPLPAVLRRLAEAGFARAAVVDMPSADAGLHVVKALVPGFLRSELL